MDRCLPSRIADQIIIVGRRGMLLMGVWAVVLVVGGAGSARAASWGDAVIVSPSATMIEDGLGYAGPIQIQWNAPGDYAIDVTGPGGYQQHITATLTTADVGTIDAYPITAVTEPGNYQIWVTNTDTQQTVAGHLLPIYDIDQAAITSTRIHLHGWQGPITAQWTRLRNPQASYIVQIQTRTGWWSMPCRYPGTLQPGQTTSCNLDTPPSIGSHTVRLVDTQSGATLATQTLTIQPHLHVTGFTQNHTNFYPFAPPGLRDPIRFGYTINKPARIQWRVKNTAGDVILHGRDHWVTTGRHLWTWTGRTDTGRITKPGYYWAQQTATASGETTMSPWHRILAKRQP